MYNSKLTQKDRIGNILLPRNHHEWTVFLLSILYFGIIDILFLHRLTTDAPPEMLGYDTSAHMMLAHKMISLQHIVSWDIRHPLLNIMFLPPLLIDHLLSLFDINYKWEIFTIYSSFISSYTGLLLYKALSYICEKKTATILLVLFYSFAHTILLSIQVDSFIYSMLFLVMLLLIYITNKQNVHSNNILFFTLIGTTSTNIIKLLIYSYLSSQRKIKEALIVFIKSMILFICMFILTIPDLFNRLFIQHLGLKYSVLAQTMDYRGISLNKLHLFITNFISEPFMFHYKENLLYANETINLPPYSNVFCHLVIIVFICLSITSIILNFNNKIVQLFLSFFSVDIFIHYIVGYGIKEGQLFCGHWFFFIPLLLGLLVNRTNNKYLKSLLTLQIVGITAFLFFHNINCYLHSI